MDDEKRLARMNLKTGDKNISATTWLINPLMSGGH
jgi:hypothetical protein